jgi:hypothetical protein
MEWQYKTVGIVFIVLALIHLGFPRYFNWGRELRTLSTINREMMIVHTFFIALIVLLMGLLCLLAANELINTILGKKIALGLGIFWGFRLLVQFFVYSPGLWRGKGFETVIHIVFSLLWGYCTVLFLWTYWR